jgi:hypothetical protein
VSGGRLSGLEDTAEHGSVPSPTGPAAPTSPTEILIPTLLSLDQLPYEGDEFGGLEGLGEEGVDADVEAALDLVLGTGADDGEGKVTSARVGTQPRCGPQPVEPRHGDIKRDDIGPHPMNDIQTLGTIGRGHDLEPLELEIDPDQLPDDLVVVHNKHPAGRAWHKSRVGPDRPPRPGFPDFHPCGVRRGSGLWRSGLGLRRSHGFRHHGNPFMNTPRELVGFYPSPPSKAPDTPP